MIDSAKIREFVEANSKRYLEMLKEACVIPSISAEGQGLGEMAAWLEARLRDLGATVSRLEVPGGPPALLGEIEGRDERTLMIYDHYDVQPVDPIDLWDSPPFQPAERDGRLYARGAADNKGDLVARLCALEAYRELFGEIPFGVKFFIEGEEESGSVHFEQICQTYSERLRADACIWEGGWFDYDGRPEMYYGCKGLLYIELRAKVLSGDQHSSIAVYAPSAAWELLRAIASMKDEGGRITIEGFYDDVLEPGEREHRLLETLPFNEEATLRRLGVDAFVGGITGAALKRELLYSPTANIAGFVTGYTVPGAAKTVLPAQAMAKMDFRLVPNQNASDIAKKVKRHLEQHGFDSIEMAIISDENPSRSPLDSPLGRAVEAAAADWFPQPTSVWPYMWATGPMYPIAQGLGIPICSPPGVGRPDSQIHAPNENARIGDFLEIAGFTVAYLDRYARA